MVEKKPSDNSTQKGSFSSKSIRPKSFALDSFRYVPSAGEKITANVSGQQPSLNISGEVKEVEFKNQTPHQVSLILFLIIMHLIPSIQQ